MKRVFSYLITSLFVLAFALGAVGCSGDLMDMDPKASLYLCNDTFNTGNNRARFIIDSQTAQHYTFTYTGENAWGAKGNLNFKINTDENKDTWVMDWGAPEKKTLTLDINGDWVEAQGRGAGGGGDPGNLVVENLVSGKEYTIRLLYNAPSKSVKVKIEGTKIDFPTLKLVEIVTGEDGKKTQAVHDMKREGARYSYIVSKEDVATFCGSASTKPFTYYITNSTNIQFWDGNGDFYDDITRAKLTTFNFDKTTGMPYGVIVDTQFDSSNKFKKVNNGIALITCLTDVYVRGFNGGWNPSTGNLLVLNPASCTETDYVYKLGVTTTATDHTFRFAKEVWDDGEWGPAAPSDTAAPIYYMRRTDNYQVEYTWPTGVTYTAPDDYGKGNIALAGLSNSTDYVFTCYVDKASDKFRKVTLETGSYTPPSNTLTLDNISSSMGTIKFKIKGAKISNTDTSGLPKNGDKVYVNGTFWAPGWNNGWPIASWGNPAKAKPDNTIDAKGECILADNNPCDINSFTVSAPTVMTNYTFKAVYSGDNWNTVIEPTGDMNVTINPLPGCNRTYYVVIDFSGASIDGGKAKDIGVTCEMD